MTFDLALGRSPPLKSLISLQLSAKSRFWSLLGASGSLYSTSGSFGELIFNLWELIFNLRELPGAYIQPPGASGSLYSTSGSFQELILNLRELPGAVLTAFIINKQLKPVEFDVLVPFMKVCRSNSIS